MKLRALAVLSVLASTLAVLAAGPVDAAAACSLIEQVTNTTGGATGSVGNPAISADGSQVAFVSNRDLTGGNPDLNGEIHLYDRDTDNFTQLTDVAGGGNPSTLPSISDDGTRIAFESVGDVTGDNPDQSSEIFVYDTVAETFTQLSDTDDALSEFADSPEISGDGSMVAYISDDNPVSTNADGSDEVFRATVAETPVTTQVSVSNAGNASRPAISENGSRVAFDHTGNLVPATGNADGNGEIFVWESSGPTTVQLTNGTGSDAVTGDLSEDGLRVIFTSNRNITGGNANGGTELFRRVIASSTTTQLTDTGVSSTNTSPSTDETGSRVVYRGFGSDQPRNADGGAETMVADGTGDPTVMTRDATGSSDQSDVSDDGLTVAVVSTSNPLGTNPDGNRELFIGRCGPLTQTFTDVPTGNVFYGQVQWMEELGIASGFPGGLFKPQDAVKRQQMAAFMYNLAGQPAFTPPVTPTFGDVPASNPFYLEVEWMVAEGIASGFPGGLFKPQDAVKRQQMANFMYNLAGQPLFSAPGTPTFNDVPTSNPFFLQIEWMAAETVASGFPGGLYKPQDPVKRQQMANFMHNFAVSPGENV